MMTRRAPRIWLLFLVLTLSPPTPVFALRPAGLEEAHSGVQEEFHRALGISSSGLEENGRQSRYLDRFWAAPDDDGRSRILREWCRENPETLAVALRNGELDRHLVKVTMEFELLLATQELLYEEKSRSRREFLRQVLDGVYRQQEWPAVAFQGADHQVHERYVSYREGNERLVQHIARFLQGKVEETQLARILEGFRKIPRYLFTPRYLGHLIYQEGLGFDRALHTGYGQPISQPTLVARKISGLDLKGGDKVLEVGTNTVWEACLMADLVGPGGHVYTTERIPFLVERARRNVQKIGLSEVVTVIQAGPVIGYPKQGPYDAIVVSAGVRKVPEELVGQLKEGGRLIAPIERPSEITQTGDPIYDLVLFTKKRGRLDSQEVVMDRTVFVPLVMSGPSSTPGAGLEEGKDKGEAISEPSRYPELTTVEEVTDYLQQAFNIKMREGFRSVVDAGSLPEVNWTMHAIRPVEKGPVFDLFDAIPVKQLVYPLKILPVLSGEGLYSAGVYLGFVEGIDHPVAVKVLKRVVKDKFYLGYLEELIHAQIIDRLGIGPRFYGVIRLSGEEIGYAMQVIPGREILGLDLEVDQDRRDIRLRTYSAGILCSDRMQTPSGRVVVMDAGNVGISDRDRRDHFIRASREGAEFPPAAGLEELESLEPAEKERLSGRGAPGAVGVVSNPSAAGLEEDWEKIEAKLDALRDLTWKLANDLLSKLKRSKRGVPFPSVLQRHLESHPAVKRQGLTEEDIFYLLSGKSIPIETLSEGQKALLGRLEVVLRTLVVNLEVASVFPDRRSALLDDLSVLEEVKKDIDSWRYRVDNPTLKPGIYWPHTYRKLPDRSVLSLIQRAKRVVGLSPSGLEEVGSKVDEEPWFPGLEPEVARRLQQNLTELFSNGEWIAAEGQDRIRRTFEGRTVPSAEVWEGSVLEGRRFWRRDERGELRFHDPENWFPQFVHGPGELHFHSSYDDREGTIQAIRGTLLIDAQGKIQPFLWLESTITSSSVRTELSEELRIPNVWFPLSELPEGYLDRLDEALKEVVGPDWKQRVRDTTPGPFFSAVPLLWDPKHQGMFLQQVKKSEGLRQVILQKGWSQEDGILIEPIEPRFRPEYVFPLVVTGDFRRTLDSGRLRSVVSPMEVSRGDLLRHWEDFYRGFDSAFSYPGNDGKPIAFFDKGLLLVKPGTRLDGKALEDVFLWGAELSNRLGDLLTDKKPWPPSATGLEEPPLMERQVRILDEEVLDVPEPLLKTLDPTGLEEAIRHAA